MLSTTARWQASKIHNQMLLTKLYAVCVSVINTFMGECNTLPEPLHLFITGGACAGKSHLISVIKEHIEQSHSECQNACMLVVPTGVAAFNIVGLTIHYAFWLAVEHGNLTRYTNLNAEKLHHLRLLCNFLLHKTIHIYSDSYHKTMLLHQP